MCSFVSENFATFCTCIETLKILNLKRGPNLVTNIFRPCGLPAESQGGDDRKKVGQYVQAGSPAEVNYYRW